MELHYLDFIAYVIISVLAWTIAPEESLEEIAILGWLFRWFIFTIIWILVFVYPVDWNISDLFNTTNWDIKFKP